MRNKKILTSILKLSVIMLVLNINLIWGKVTFAYSENEVKDNNTFMEWFNNTLNYKVNGMRVEVNDKLYGYVSYNETVNTLCQEVAKIYIHDLGIDSETITSIDVKLPIKMSKESVTLSQITCRESIARQIFDDKGNNDLDIKIKIIQEFNESIESSTKYLKTNTLYMGRQKSIEGKDGVKNITKLITYSLNDKVDEIVLDEEVVQVSTSNIIYQGEKNPYIDGVAFLKMPIDNDTIITSYFGERWNKLHKGIDFAADTGERVGAALNGEVIYAQYNNGGYGNLVIIEHDNNMKSYYAHLNQITTNVGDEVNIGDKIGEVGNTGFSTGPHLHFELRVDDNPVDPLGYIENL